MDRLSTYWSEKPRSSWSLLDYDMAKVKQTPDITKHAAHSLFAKDLDTLEASNSNNRDVLSSILILRKQLKRANRNKEITNFWAKVKDELAAEALQSAVRDFALTNAVKGSITTTLEKGIEAQQAESSTSEGES